MADYDYTKMPPIEVVINSPTHGTFRMRGTEEIDQFVKLVKFLDGHEMLLAYARMIVTECIDADYLHDPVVVVAGALMEFKFQYENIIDAVQRYIKAHSPTQLDRLYAEYEDYYNSLA